MFCISGKIGGVSSGRGSTRRTLDNSNSNNSISTSSGISSRSTHSSGGGKSQVLSIN